jgi:hypothetical protein
VNTILQPARAVVFVKKVGGDDAIRPEMPKILTKLTQGGQHTQGLSIADDHQGTLAVLCCVCQCSARRILVLPRSDRRRRTFGKMVHRSKAMRKMNVRTLPELGRMAEKLQLVSEKPQHS